MGVGRNGADFALLIIVVYNLSQSQEANYNFLLDLQQHVLKKMKAGVRAKDVYADALAYVKEKKPELEASFPKTLGHGVRMASDRFVMHLFCFFSH